MELSKKHRRALLDELETAKESLISNRKCINNNDAEEINDFFEISCFLAQKRIELIEQSLIDNEIDF